MGDSSRSVSFSAYQVLVFPHILCVLPSGLRDDRSDCRSQNSGHSKGTHTRENEDGFFYPKEEPSEKKRGRICVAGQVNSSQKLLLFSCETP